MRTFEVDSKSGLNILQTKLRWPTLLSTCANKTSVEVACTWSCCDRKFRAACAQSFAPWQQATI